MKMENQELTPLVPLEKILKAVSVKNPPQIKEIPKKGSIFAAEECPILKRYFNTMQVNRDADIRILPTGVVCEKFERVKRTDYWTERCSITDEKCQYYNLVKEYKEYLKKQND